MSRKGIALGSRRVSYAVGTLSKSTLADILIDRIYAEIGEDATDEQFAACLQPWLDTAARLREEKPAGVAALMARLDKSDAKIADRKRRQPEIDAALAARDARERAIAAKVAEFNRAELSKPAKPWL